MEKNTEDALDSCKIYIERNESPYNYMTFDGEEECKRVIEVKKVQQTVLEEKEAKIKQEENLEKILKQQKE